MVPQIKLLLKYCIFDKKIYSEKFFCFEEIKKIRTVKEKSSIFQLNIYKTLKLLSQAIRIAHLTESINTFISNREIVGKNRRTQTKRFIEKVANKNENIFRFEPSQFWLRFNNNFKKLQIKYTEKVLHTFLDNYLTNSLIFGILLW